MNKLLKTIESLINRLKSLFSKAEKSRSFMAPACVKIVNGDDTQVLKDMGDEEFTEFALKMTTLNFDRIELSYTVKGDSLHNDRVNKSIAVNLGRTVVLHKQDGRLVLLFFDDKKRTMYNLIYDKYIYCNVDSKEVKNVPFNGTKVREYMIHPDDSTIKDELYMLLENIVDPYIVVDKYNVWGWYICTALPHKYARLKKEIGLIVE